MPRFHASHVLEIPGSLFSRVEKVTHYFDVHQNNDSLFPSVENNDSLFSWVENNDIFLTNSDSLFWAVSSFYCSESDLVPK